MPREYLLYLDDIENSCQKILRFTKGLKFDEFRRDELIYDAIIREAAKNIPDEIKVKYPGVEWRKISGLRDVIVHAYFGIDDLIIWEVIQTKIPHLLKLIK